MRKLVVLECLSDRTSSSTALVSVHVGLEQSPQTPAQKSRLFVRAARHRRRDLRGLHEPCGWVFRDAAELPNFPTLGRRLSWTTSSASAKIVKANAPREGGDHDVPPLGEKDGRSAPFLHVIFMTGAEPRRAIHVENRAAAASFAACARSSATTSREAANQILAWRKEPVGHPWPAFTLVTTLAPEFERLPGILEIAADRELLHPGKPFLH